MWDNRATAKNKDFEFIFFDLGDVLFIGITSEHMWLNFLSKINIPKNKIDEFNKLYDKYEPQFNLGYMPVSEFQQIANKELNLNFPKEFDLQKAMIDEFKPNTDIIKVVKNIQGKYRIGILSNMYIGMMDEIKSRGLIPNANWEIIIDSSKIHMIKPERSMFEYAQNQIGVEPNKILFVDNARENVDAAIEAGWHGFFYDQRDYAQSAKKLHEFLLS